MKNYLIGCKTDKGNLWIQHPGLSIMWRAANHDLCSAEDIQAYVKFLSGNLKTKFKYIDIDECYDGKDLADHIEIELYDDYGNLLEAAE